jgi:hypothetical protein
MRFSERHNHKPIKSIIQVNSVDEALRNSLWSALKLCYWDTFQPTRDLYVYYYLSGYGNESLRLLCQRLWISYFKKPIDTLSDDWEAVLAEIRDYYFNCQWYEVYDLIEFIATNYPEEETNKVFVDMCNNFMERELSGYRFVGGNITPITTEEEISAIEEALKSKKNPVREHIIRSLELLSDRKNPDYRNAIKEAISAVESIAIIITGNEKATLGQLLNVLEKQSILHPALKESFSKLYGYTSNANGIRHGLIDEDTVTFEKAKFMVVACSAFINYVTAIVKL